MRRAKTQYAEHKAWVLSQREHQLMLELERECEDVELKVYEQVFAQAQDDLAATSASKKAFLDAKEAGLLKIEGKLVALAEALEAEETVYPIFWDLENGFYVTDSLDYYELNCERYPGKWNTLTVYDDSLDTFVFCAIENLFDDEEGDKMTYASSVSIAEIKKILVAGKEITWLPGGEKIELGDLEPKKMKAKMRKLRAEMRKLRAEKNA